MLNSNIRKESAFLREDYSFLGSEYQIRLTHDFLEGFVLQESLQSSIRSPFPANIYNSYFLLQMTIFISSRLQEVI